MGNHRFKLSYMMPNAWFYKLKDMTRSTSKKTHYSSSTTTRARATATATTTTPKPIPISPPKEPFIPNRPSVYLPSKPRTSHLSSSPIHPKASDTHLPPDPPRISKRRARRKPPRTSPNLVASESDDVESLVHVADQVRLAPIVTRPIARKEKGWGSPPRIRRVKTTRGSSPKIGGRRTKGGFGSCRSLARSIAVVKSSSDPEKDFRESMVEMIVENDIRSARGLEDLLACYLSLNSDEYHDIIVHVFEHIWIELTQLKFIELA